MKSPHVSPEPPPFLTDRQSNVTEKSSSRSTATGSLKTSWTEKVASNLVYKKKSSTLTKENLEDFDKRWYNSSPYYKGLLFTEKPLGTSAEVESTTPIPHEFTSPSPYYKGLLFTEKVLGASSEAESTTPIAHDFTSPSPYYKGLLYYPERVTPTSPDRESSTSRTSFTVKMPELGFGSCFLFRSRDEKTPTMVKVYSTESSNQESLRERGSETTSPQLLPPSHPSLPPTLPPLSPPPLVQPSPPKVVVTKEDVEPKEEKKYTWADKYRPNTLGSFICNKEKAKELQKTIKDEECRHFIFEGQAGVGKRTMIWALLRDAYGHDKVQARDQCKTFNLKGEEVSSIIVNVKESSQHVEVNLSDLKGFEKHVIVELIKEANMLTNKARCGTDNCRAIILHEADKLSTDALLYIRWVIERYRGCHKVFFCCQDASKLQHLMNICKLIRFLPPSNKEIVEVLELIAKKEKIDLPRQLAERIAVNSKNNLRQAIRSFEASWHHNPILEGDQIILSGWEEDIADIAKSIIEKQSPKQLYHIRQKLQNLIDHSVPPEFIFETLKVDLKKNVEESMHKQIEKTYKEYTGKGSERFSNDERKKLIQQFMNIEEFIAKFMSCYKNHLAKQALDLAEPTIIK
ncbi:replication factor C subunit 3-like [Bidens hawaiensis]|uniref:replication factor C subunit 3-like n=1 Tax=Bidens hawaiensis TaxID=980011 RepID=UPI00404B76DC